MLEEIEYKYEYLAHLVDNSMGVEPWLWEFIRRNDEYRSLFRGLNELLPKSPMHFAGPVYSDTDMFLQSEDKQTIRIIWTMREKFGITPNANVKADPVGNYLTKEIPYQGTINEIYVVGFPNPEIPYNRFKSPPVIKGAKPIEKASFNERSVSLRERKPERFKQYCTQIIEKISPSQDLKNTIYIGISRYARKEILRKYLEEIIENFIEPPQDVRLRLEQWRYYLIVFDLRITSDPRMTFGKISGHLSQAYPDNKDVIDEITIQKYFKKCQKLIESEYKKFMYLE